MESFSRANFIVNKINENGKVSVIELAAELGVSTETIRRDLTVLDKKGELVKVHGGAVCKPVEDVSRSFSRRATDNLEDKQELAAKVIPHLFEGAIIGLDASSTSWLVAKAMPNVACTVVTHSIYNVEALSGKDNIKIVGLGGVYSERHKAFFGIHTNEKLQEMSLDICVLSCSGYDEKSGVWDSNENNYQVKRTFMQVSDKTVLLADKSKHKKKSLLRLCGLDEIDMFVTNIVC